MTETVTLLICSECGNGHYFGSGVFTCTNPTCGHSVAPWDVVLDEGERLMAPSFGSLGYVTV